MDSLTSPLATIEVVNSFAEVPGGEIFVRQWRTASAAGAPVVLLHDSLGCVDLWREFPEHLARETNRPVIAYDRLGFGRSTLRTERSVGNFIDEEAERFFPAIRDALKLERFALLGHSVGGAMALRIAASLRESCEAVITESAQCFVEARTLASIRAAKSAFEDPEQLNRLAKWHGARAQWVLDAWTEVWLSPEFASWTLDPWLGRVRCPVLAIHGDQDEYGSEEFPRRIANGVAGPAEKVVLERCGHVPHREQREEVLRWVGSFLGTA